MEYPYRCTHNMKRTQHIQCYILFKWYSKKNKNMAENNKTTRDAELHTAEPSCDIVIHLNSHTKPVT